MRLLVQIYKLDVLVENLADCTPNYASDFESQLSLATSSTTLPNGVVYSSATTRGKEKLLKLSVRSSRRLDVIEVGK